VLWPDLCAGLNRLEAENGKFSQKGLAICSAPSLALGIARYTAKRRQGYRRGGQLSCGMSRKERERLMCSVGGKPTEAKVRTS
jgi:hypothetical protein